MAPAASILAATSAASSKRPADSVDADHLLAAESSSALTQGDAEAARGKNKQQQLECPRCRSTNTKFCYYNNYSTAQPRHFCRACRRYWTHGGTLRDVPVGGATRRAKRRRVSDSTELSSSPPQTTTALVSEDTCPPDLSSTAFPFLSDGSYLPQFDLGIFGPAALSSWSSVLPDFYEGIAPTWDNGTVGAAGVTGAWGDVTGLDFSWPPPGN